jgi:hypothetical protein
VSDEYTDTPETDHLEISMDEQDYVPRDKLMPYADLCRKLERERDDWKQEAKQEKARRERSELNSNYRRKIIQNMSEELRAITRQRDEMTKQFNKAMSENLELRKNDQGMARAEQLTNDPNNERHPSPSLACSPVEIFLQWHGDADPNEIGDVEPSEVTWCADQVFRHDVRYVRWDKVEPILRDILQDHADESSPFYNHCDQDKCQMCEWASELFLENAGEQAQR